MPTPRDVLVVDEILTRHEVARPLQRVNGNDPVWEVSDWTQALEILRSQHTAIVAVIIGPTLSGQADGKEVVAESVERSIPHIIVLTNDSQLSFVHSRVQVFRKGIDEDAFSQALRSLHATISP